MIPLRERVAAAIWNQDVASVLDWVDLHTAINTAETRHERSFWKLARERCYRQADAAIAECEAWTEESEDTKDVGW